MIAARYAATERLRNARCWKSVRCGPPTGRDAGPRSGGPARKRSTGWFFGPKQSFSEREMEFFLEVDFISHVAPGGGCFTKADDSSSRRGARYIVSQPGRAELAFVIDDPHQKARHCDAPDHSPHQIARAAGLKEFVAEVLPENLAMLKVFRTLRPCHDDAP
jgi:hypothetical protein